MTCNIFANNAGKYGTLGWAIFPLAEGQKVPMKGTDGFKSASAHRAQIGVWGRQHPDANIGIATGKVSGIIVIDIDVQNGGPGTVARLAKEDKTFPETVEAKTPSGGKHLFFAYDSRIVTGGAHKIGRGIDLKTDGGYVVAAPSFWRKTGAFYRWVRPPRGVELPRLPRWLVEALMPKLEPKRPMRKIDYHHLQGYRRQALADLDQAVSRLATRSDGRHEAPFKVASALGKYVAHKVLTESDLENALMDACLLNGALRKYSRKDLLTQLRNGLKKASGDQLPPLARIHAQPVRVATTEQRGAPCA